MSRNNPVQRSNPFGQQYSLKDFVTNKYNQNVQGLSDIMSEYSNAPSLSQVYQNNLRYIRENPQELPSLQHMVNRGVNKAVDWMNPVSGLIGTFAGKGAKTAYKEMLELAKEADKIGLPMERIRDATGWMKGADGKWRFEIDDIASSMTGKPPAFMDEIAGKEYPVTTGRLSSVMQHDKGYSAYPDLAKVNTRLQVGYPTASGEYVEAMGSHPPLIQGRLPMGANEKQSLLLHEGQHHIQGQEGFAMGGSPEMFRSVGLGQMVQADKNIKQMEGLRPLLKYLNSKGITDTTSLMDSGALKSARNIYGDDAITNLDAFTNGEYTTQGLDAAIARQKQNLDFAGSEQFAQQQYKNLAGEVEARNVEKRMGLTADDRAMYPPHLSEDVPRSEQIIRYKEELKQIYKAFKALDKKTPEEVGKLFKR